MLLLILFITLFVVSISIYIFVINYNKEYHETHKNKIMEFVYYYDDEINTSCIFSFIITGLVLFIMIVCLITIYIPSNANKLRLEEQYNSLIYKAQTKSIRDEFGIINKSFIDEIQDWNMDVVKYKELTNNIWIGIFYPDWFNGFETIDLNSIVIKDIDELR